MKLLNPMIGVLLTGIALSTTAAPVTQINRYATVENKPLPEQVSPLKAVQQIHFPQEVKSIGDAVNYWLHYSGFHLASETKQPNTLKQILSQPLPQVDRSLGPLDIESGLLVLVGKHDFVLEEVSFTREINFQQKGRIS